MATPRPLPRVLTALAAAAALTLLPTACGGGASPGAAASPTPAATATAPLATPTPTPSPTPTATPSPTPTPDATTLGIAGPPRAATPFPTPPPREGTLPPNDSGIARVVAPGLINDLYIEVIHVVDNQMQSPVDGEYSVGWYPEYGMPGAADNAVFAAHETWNHFQGPFYHLHLAQPGDPISIEMSDGTTYHYEVMSEHRYAVATIPMADILWPKDRPAGEQWITLMTCGGRIVYDSTGFGEYLDRDVIVAKRVS